MTNYEQHNETFHYEMEVLKNRSEDPEITCIPLKLIFDMWDVSNKLMSELDQLDAMGTNIPSLTMTALRLRSLIFVIPESLNIENRAENAGKENTYDNHDA